MLTGEHAFSFGAQAEPMVAVLENEIMPVARRRHSVPGAVAAVVERAMHKEPLQRFRTAGDMQQALLAAAGGPDPSSRLKAQEARTEPA